MGGKVEKFLIWLALPAAGIFYGLAFPSHSIRFYSAFALAALAFPLFLLLTKERFGLFSIQIFAFFLSGASVALWWVYPTHPVATFLGISVLALCIALPFFVLHPLGRFLGKGGTLLIFPFMWAGWEWLFTKIEFCIPLLFYGNTQALNPVIIQYAAVTGVWGVSFWLAAVNALLAAVAWNMMKPETVFKRLWIYALILSLPPIYSLTVFDAPSPAAGKDISVLLVQPGLSTPIKTEQEWDGHLKRLADFTGWRMAVKPDLVVWPEAAVSTPLFEDLPRRDYLFSRVREWGVPLLTGTLDLRLFPNAPPPAENRYWEKHKERNAAYKQDYDFFNAAVLITPELAAYIPPGQSANVKAYRKRRLFPFVEFIPYVDTFPMLAKFDLSLRPDSMNFALGGAPETFVFKSRAGDKTRVGALICFEEFYPDLGADLASTGSQIIAVLADEWAFRPAASHAFIDAVSSIRAIETGMPVLRSAANGIISTVDAHGMRKVYSTSAAHGAILASVTPSGGGTFFTRHKSWFPAACLFIASFLAAGATFSRRDTHHR